MRIAVLSDCRMPTKATGGHGLGRLAWDLATGLAQAGHGVWLCAGVGSEAPNGVQLSMVGDETWRAKFWGTNRPDVTFDSIIDLSHKHDLSRLKPQLPVINWVVDLECHDPLPYQVVGNRWQAQRFPTARIVPLGIDVQAIRFFAEPVEPPYLAFAAKVTLDKGADRALEVHTRQDVPVRFVGERFPGDGGALTPLPWHRDELIGAEFYRFVGQAQALLSPSRRDAGGRVNLEAAATGTPVLCLDGTGTAAHVEHGVSGFICRDVDELADAVEDAPLLNRRKAREWAADTHDLSVMIRAMGRLCEAVADGEAW